MRCKYALLTIIAVFLISCGGDGDNGVKPDTTPPTVVSTNPFSDATNVHLNADISATFSEELDASTVDSTVFVISGGVSGTVTYGDRTINFRPDADLATNQLYAVAITTDVMDLAGNALAENYVWQFTTAEVMLMDAAEYFPFAEDDIWYYRDTTIQNPAMWNIVREVSGDTTIENRSCTKILHDSVTAEAWSIDTAGFNFHLLSDSIFNFRFEPPLVIPFDLAQEEPYNYSSTAYWMIGDTLNWSEISGTLKFKGYTTYDTPSGIHFDDVIRFFYIPDGYSEYYARGVGLLDNERFILDSAYVGGVWYR